MSLSTIQAQIATSRLDPTRPITINTLISSNAVHGISGYGGIKLLGDVDPTLPPLPPLSLTLSRFSKTAAKAVIDAGGEVTAVYHNALSLRREIMPHKFLGKEIRLAQPIKKTDIGECTSVHPVFSGHVHMSVLTTRIRRILLES